MINDHPLVSIVTPVHNGEKYLAECIESVLAQTYQNWDYTVVDNCSTDRTLEIAQNYAKEDSRIRVVSNSQFEGVIESHNVAFRLISRNSRYCKVVSADDWIYPECITKLVEAAERNPTVGITGSYAIRTNGIRWIGLPIDRNLFSGREVCRLYLLGKIDFFGMPTGVLYSSLLVRSADPFFPGPNPNADAVACFKCLQVSDFAFVHQILSFERVHEKAVSGKLSEINAFSTAYPLQFLQEYGHIFLSNTELEDRLEEVIRDYYSVLASEIFNCKNKEFWTYHKIQLKESGLSLYGVRLMKAVSAKVLDLILNPKQTVEKIIRRILNRRHGLRLKG